MARRLECGDELAQSLTAEARRRASEYRESAAAVKDRERELGESILRAVQAGASLGAVSSAVEFSRTRCGQLMRLAADPAAYRAELAARAKAARRPASVSA